MVFMLMQGNLFLFGSLDLNAAESGVQHKPATPRNPINTDQAPIDKGCACWWPRLCPRQVDI